MKKLIFSAINAVKIRRIRSGDEKTLVEFYNGLSESSKRTFQPLGVTTTLDVCEKIVQDNRSEIDKKLDLVALHETLSSSEVKEQIVGWGFLWNIRSDQPTFGLGVADDFQGKGLGSKLMDSLIEEARKREIKKIFLTVVKDNHVALKLYESRGFVKYGELLGNDGLDYWRMVAEPA